VSIPGDAELDRLRWVADPHADETVAEILGPWDESRTAERFARVDELNAAIRGWQSNAAVQSWQGGGWLAEPIQRYLSAAQPLPPWADTARIARAESMFMEYGALSVTMLFCASLPDCYVVPDLAAVLHATGQLDDRAEHRIRTTGAMIFPVMMRGGLTSPEGAGIAQVLKVRLIHATIRNLILRGRPEAAVPGSIRPLAAIRATDTMASALHVHGWDLAERALPNNQEELAYTLLTFSYVFLRAMRRIGNGFSAQQEEDYLHAWNVAGHFLGIRRELMVDTMKDAGELFARMQARGRAAWAAKPQAEDPRKSLGAALMEAMQTVIPPGPLKPFPVLLTRRLIGRDSSRDLGLDDRVSAASKTLFAALMGTSRGIDAAVRLIFPSFSISRFVTRIVGYHLTCALLMSQTRELAVPSTLRPGIRSLVAGWGNDAHAPQWLNSLEDRWTTQGAWQPR